jgi:hypothetical protein
MSPLGLVSAGMAMARSAGSMSGGRSSSAPILFSLRFAGRSFGCSTLMIVMPSINRAEQGE